MSIMSSIKGQNIDRIEVKTSVTLIMSSIKGQKIDRIEVSMFTNDKELWPSQKFLTFGPSLDRKDQARVRMFEAFLNRENQANVS